MSVPVWKSLVGVPWAEDPIDGSPIVAETGVRIHRRTMEALQEREYAGPCVERSERAVERCCEGVASQGSEHMTEQTVEMRAGRKTYPGMAHFAGTGPAGMTCRLCRWWENDQGNRWLGGGTLKAARCAKYTALLDQKGKTIPHDAAACKYFEGRGRAPDAVVTPATVTVTERPA